MKKKDVWFVPQVDFKEQTPEFCSKMKSRILFMRKPSFPVRIKAQRNMLKIRQPGTKAKTEYLKSVREKRSNADHLPIASTGRWKPYGEPARITFFELQSEKEYPQ